ncbi:MAG: hypothetical protein ACRCT6_06200 [Notoacmeibacter sp.]
MSALVNISIWASDFDLIFALRKSTMEPKILRYSSQAICPIGAGVGHQAPGDDPYEQIFYPAAERLISICDAMLRLPGENRGQTTTRSKRKYGGFRYFEALPKYRQRKNGPIVADLEAQWPDGSKVPKQANLVVGSIGKK